MKVVSFFCDVDNSTFFSDSAKRLVKQCRSLDIDHYIVERSFGKTWIDNVRAKPLFLIEALDVLREPIIWLDCDSSVHRRPDFTIRSDWAVCMQDKQTPCDYAHYVANSTNARAFLDKWIETIETQQRGSHTAFISIFRSISPEILPSGYFTYGAARTRSKRKYLAQAQRASQTK